MPSISLGLDTGTFALNWVLPVWRVLPPYSYDFLISTQGWMRSNEADPQPTMQSFGDLHLVFTVTGPVQSCKYTPGLCETCSKSMPKQFSECQSKFPPTRIQVSSWSLGKHRGFVHRTWPRNRNSEDLPGVGFICNQHCVPSLVVFCWLAKVWRGIIMTLNWQLRLTLSCFTLTVHHPWVLSILKSYANLKLIVT